VALGKDDGRFYNIDDLQGIADDYLQQRKEEIILCEQIIREKVKSLLGHGSGGSPSDHSRPAFESR